MSELFGKEDSMTEYIGVHVRRGDFVKYRKSVSLKHIAFQLKQKLFSLNLNTVFLATDGTFQGKIK